METIVGSDDSFLATRTRLSDQLSDIKLKKLSTEKDAESHRASIVALESRTGETEERVRQLQENIALLHQQNLQREEQMAAMQRDVEQSRQQITEFEQAIQAASQQRIEKEGAITQQSAKLRRLTDEREALGREAARLTEQKEAKDAEYEQTVAKLWDEYELGLSEAQALCVPFESITELRRNVTEVRGKIRSLGKDVYKRQLPGRHVMISQSVADKISDTKNPQGIFRCV